MFSMLRTFVLTSMVAMGAATRRLNEPAAAAPTDNIVQLAESVPALSTLVKLVVAADLATTLSGTGPFTVFAPTNDAFDKLGEATLKKLLEPENKAELVKILTFHVASGNVQSKDLTDGEKITTVEGDDVTAHVSAAGVYINNAQVIQADVEATNGVVHVVDTVLLPPTPAPTPAPKKKNIVELAESVKELSILVRLIEAADLVDTLSGTGPFTVFAPTNEAFEHLGKATLEHLLDPKNKDELVKILTYHVASGNVQSKDLKDHEKIKTVEGSDVEAFVQDRHHIFINNAEVEEADVEASNGVVHVVGRVLIPHSEE